MCFVVLHAACSRDVAVGPRAVAGQNVLLVTIDTLRADALGCYGGPAATPALDRLAAGGVRFDFAHAHAVTTLASHASILTGTYPFQHGIRDNSGYRLPAGSTTIATRLKAAGYATAAFVGAFPVHSRFGLNQGFEVYDDAFGDARAPDEFAMPERPAGEVVRLCSIVDCRTTRAGLARPSRPSVVRWVHVFDPHAPYRPPPPFDREYAAQPYYGEVAAVDAALAPLFEDIRAARRPTLVIVTGDHGEALGDHGEQSHGLFAYESTLRVPLIITELAQNGTHNTQSSQKSFWPGSVMAAERGIVASIPRATSTSCRRSSPASDWPRRDLPGRSLLTRPTAPTRRRGRRTSKPCRRCSTAGGHRSTACWSIARSTSSCRFRSATTSRAMPVSGPISAVDRRNAIARSPRALRGFNAAPPGERQAEDADAAARLRALGYVSGSAAPKTRYTEADDPKRLVDVDQQIHRAVDAFTAGRAAEASQLYAQVIARRPDMAIAYRHLAFVEWQRGDASGAIDVLRRGVKAGVTDPRLAGQLGEYLTETGRMQEGITLLESVAGGAGADLDALNALGIAYAQAGRADKARAIFERVLAVNASSSVPLENLGLLALDRGDVVEARRQFERAAAVNPRSSRAQAGIGNVAIRSGDRAGAIDAWKRAVALDPRNFDALYNVGTALARAGDLNAARPYLEQFLRSAPPALYRKDLDEVARLLKREPGRD